jgi:hypothetical protein
MFQVIDLPEICKTHFPRKIARMSSAHSTLKARTFFTISTQLFPEL